MFTDDEKVRMVAAWRTELNQIRSGLANLVGEIPGPTGYLLQECDDLFEALRDRLNQATADLSERAKHGPA